MSSKKLTILAFPLSSMGHICATLGLTNVLKQRGHRIVYATEASFKGTFKELGYDEEVYQEQDEPAEKPGKFWCDIVEQTERYLHLPPIERFSIFAEGLENMKQVVIYANNAIKQMIERVKPDVIIQDTNLCCPAVVTSGVPYVLRFSANPLGVFPPEGLPPGASGYSLVDNTEWNNFRQAVEAMAKPVWEDFSNFISSHGLPKLPYMQLQFYSSNLNLYLYPERLVSEYRKVKNFSLDETWFGTDHSVRPPLGNFKLPEQFARLPGKLIYFSMGSLGASAKEMMGRLLSIFSRIEHKFIVAKGFHDHALGENMYGMEIIPQIDVLPMVDLVITHGGNNTFTETLYFGKPMIVLPLFFDQLDNAQMAEHAKVGLRFDACTVTYEELDSAIETLTSDTGISARLSEISREMQNSGSLVEAARRIELVAENPKCPTYVA